MYAQWLAVLYPQVANKPFIRLCIIPVDLSLDSGAGWIEDFYKRNFPSVLMSGEAEQDSSTLFLCSVCVDCLSVHASENY